MKYILDSSAAFKWAVPEPGFAKADQLRDEYLNGVHELLAPDVFPFEIAHALTRAERQARITLGQARSLWLTVMATTPQLVPGLPLAQRAIAISSQIRIGVYDCCRVGRARRLRTHHG